MSDNLGNYWITFFGTK